MRVPRLDEIDHLPEGLRGGMAAGTARAEGRKVAKHVPAGATLAVEPVASDRAHFDAERGQVVCVIRARLVWRWYVPTAGWVHEAVEL